MITISLAIPTYNSSTYLRKNLDPIIPDPRIEEIVICDDGSADFPELEKSFQGILKARLTTNEKNIGATGNKTKAVSLCKTSWAILLDDDNIIDTKFIDTLYTQYWGNGDIIYCPSFAKPAFNFNFISGKLIDRQYVSTHMEDRLLPFLNDGNYLVPTREYVACANKNVVGTNLVPDVILFALFWMKAGNKLKVVPGLEYGHTMHPDSFWMRNQERGMHEVQLIRAAMTGNWELDPRAINHGH